MSGHTYPISWRVELPTEGLAIELKPTILDQELDTRPTTGVAYWEGSQIVVGISQTGPTVISGEAYVEVTRYGE